MYHLCITVIFHMVISLNIGIVETSIHHVHCIARPSWLKGVTCLCVCPQVLIVDSKTLKVLKSFKLTGNAIKSIEFARRGR